MEQLRGVEQGAWWAVLPLPQEGPLVHLEQWGLELGHVQLLPKHPNTKRTPQHQDEFQGPFPSQFSRQLGYEDRWVGVDR